MSSYGFAVETTLNVISVGGKNHVTTSVYTQVQVQKMFNQIRPSKTKHAFKSYFAD